MQQGYRTLNAKSSMTADVYGVFMAALFVSKADTADTRAVITDSSIVLFVFTTANHTYPVICRHGI